MSKTTSNLYFRKKYSIFFDRALFFLILFIFFLLFHSSALFAQAYTEPNLLQFQRGGGWFQDRETQMRIVGNKHIKTLGTAQVMRNFYVPTTEANGVLDISTRLELHGGGVLVAPNSIPTTINIAMLEHDSGGAQFPHIRNTNIDGINNYLLAFYFPDEKLVFNMKSGNTSSMNFTYGSVNTAMTINQVGNVGIGVLDPRRALQLAGAMSTNGGEVVFARDDVGIGAGAPHGASGEMTVFARNFIDFDRLSSSTQMRMVFTLDPGQVTFLNILSIGPQSSAFSSLSADAISLEVDGDMSVGLVTPLTLETGSNVHGPVLYPSGIPDNSDPVYIRRFNVSSDSTRLRHVLGDNGGDRIDFVRHGAATNGDYSFSQIASFTNNGASFSSDRRLKTSIWPIRDVLSSVQRLEGVGFFRQNPSSGEVGSDRIYGFIAQDVKKIFPHLVSQDTDGYYQLSYDRMLPILIQAVRERQDEIYEMQERVDRLAARVDAMRASQ